MMPDISLTGVLVVAAIGQQALRVDSWLPGCPEATEADPNAFERTFSSPEMHGFFERIRADHDAPEAVSLPTLLAVVFDRLTQFPGYTPSRTSARPARPRSS
jgi:hypothetical protein